MTRKLITLFATTLLLFGLIPAGVAMGAVTGGASLTQGAEVFPGPNTFTVNVTNNNMRLIGSAANFVRVILPPNMSATACPDTVPSGWTCSVQTGLAHSYTFRGGSLGAGASQAFDVPATVNRPLNKDQASSFEVALSDDNGQSTSRASGSLTAIVRILEVVGSGMGATAPAGAADGSGTGGQSISYSVPVRNHAQQSVTVTPTLASNGGDTIGSAAPAAVAAGTTRAFAFPVTLRSTASDVQANFTAGASATDATARAAQAAYAIQAPPRLTLNAASIAPRSVRSNEPITYTFTVSGAKAGTPAIAGLSGTLRFACTSVPLDTPRALAAGPQSGLTFSFEPTTVCGEQGEHTPEVTLTGTDGNGAPYAQTLSASTIDIDNLAPVISDLVVDLPGSQTATKDGDEITVSGNIDEVNATLDFVSLQVAGGQTIPMDCTRSATGFTCTKVVEDWGVDFGQFTASAQASDLAGNAGGAGSQPSVIDALAPSLAGPGVTLAVDPEISDQPVIQVFFDDRTAVSGGCDPSQWRVTDNLVTSVRYASGDMCESGAPAADGSNYRLLVLLNELGPNDEPSVEYAPGTTPVSDESADQAAAEAPAATIDTVSGIVPAAPQIIALTRNAGSETMVFDEEKYWTRFGGSDAVASIGGAARGYFIEVLDQNNNVLARTPADGEADTTAVPIGTTAGEYQRKIRLVNHRGLVGEATPLTIVLDRTAPGLSSVAESANDVVAVAFNEKIWAGSNFANNWLTFETNPAPAPGERTHYAYAVQSVTGNDAARSLASDMQDLGPFAGVEYTLDTEITDNVRYEDRAGNRFANTRSF